MADRPISVPFLSITAYLQGFLLKKSLTEHLTIIPEKPLFCKCYFLTEGHF
jgi:hypothetical protein